MLHLRKLLTTYFESFFDNIFTMLSIYSLGAYEIISLKVLNQTALST